MFGVEDSACFHPLGLVGVWKIQISRCFVVWVSSLTLTVLSVCLTRALLAAGLRLSHLFRPGWAGPALSLPAQPALHTAQPGPCQAFSACGVGHRGTACHPLPDNTATPTGTPGLATNITKPSHISLNSRLFATF